MNESKNTRIIILCCFLASVCEGIDLQAAGVAAAGLRAEFAPTPQMLGQFFSASTIGLFFGAIIGGRVSDRIGRKYVLIASMFTYGIFSLFTPLCGSMESLTILRLLTGVGLGGALPNMIAMVAENSPPDRRSWNITKVFSGTPFGGAVISLVGLFYITTNWRVVFYFGGIAPLVAAVIIMFAVKNPARVDHQKNAMANCLPDGPVGVKKAGGFLALFTEGRASRTIFLYLSIFISFIVFYVLLNWLPMLLKGAGLGMKIVMLFFYSTSPFAWRNLLKLRIRSLKISKKCIFMVPISTGLYS